MTRVACYHGRIGRLNGTYGQPVRVLQTSPRGTHPRNALVEFADGSRVVTSVGCVRWVCDKHPKGAS